MRYQVTKTIGTGSYGAVVEAIDHAREYIFTNQSYQKRYHTNIYYKMNCFIAIFNFDTYTKNENVIIKKDNSNYKNSFFDQFVFF